MIGITLATVLTLVIFFAGQYYTIKQNEKNEVMRASNESMRASNDKMRSENNRLRKLNDKMRHIKTTVEIEESNIIQKEM